MNNENANDLASMAENQQHSSQLPYQLPKLNQGPNKIGSKFIHNNNNVVIIKKSSSNNINSGTLKSRNKSNNILYHKNSMFQYKIKDDDLQVG